MSNDLYAVVARMEAHVVIRRHEIIVTISWMAVERGGQGDTVWQVVIMATRKQLLWYQSTEIGAVHSAGIPTMQLHC